MGEVNNASDAPPPPPPPPPPVDAQASGDGDVPDDTEPGRDETVDENLPKLEHTAEGRPGAPAEELMDGDVGTQETTADQPETDPLPAGQEPPTGKEPPGPVTPADPPAPSDPPDGSGFTTPADLVTGGGQGEHTPSAGERPVALEDSPSVDYSNSASGSDADRNPASDGHGGGAASVDEGLVGEPPQESAGQDSGDPLGGDEAETPDGKNASGYVLEPREREYIEGRHFLPGAENHPDKSYFTIPREDLDKAIELTLEQDPMGIPNTNGRTGTIHRAQMPVDFGDEGYIGRAGAASGGYELDWVEVILNDDGSAVRDAYPWNQNQTNKAEIDE
ncbi:hypothetical protein ACFQ7B_24680 [Streptomyces erythrochromogenes]|uniref:hypothetical protein n=1 Tax=Streptomyces erythrochromogenes TaxID=285574 RepID=UPI0036AC296E